MHIYIVYYHYVMLDKILFPNSWNAILQYKHEAAGTAVLCAKLQNDWTLNETNIMDQ